MEEKMSEVGAKSAANLLRYIRRSYLLTDLMNHLEIRFHEEKPFILLVGEDHTNISHSLAHLVIIKDLLSCFSPSDITISYELRHDLPQRIEELISEKIDNSLVMDCVAACIEESARFAPAARASMLRTVSKWGIGCQFTDTSFMKLPHGSWIIAPTDTYPNPSNEVCPQSPRGILLRNQFAFAQTTKIIDTHRPKIHIHLCGAIHVRGGNFYDLDAPYRESLSCLYNEQGYDVMGVVMSSGEMNEDFCRPRDYSPPPNSFFGNLQPNIWIPGTTHISRIDDEGKREKELTSAMMIYLFPEVLQDTQAIHSPTRKILTENRDKIRALFPD